MRELYRVKDLELQTDLSFIAEPLHALFGDSLESLKVASLYVVEDAGEYITHMLLAVKEDLILQLPGTFAFGVVVDDPEDWPLILCEIVTGAGTQSLSLQHFPLRIGIPIPQLRPVAIDGQPQVLDTFSFEIEGGFTVANDLSVSATLDGFSVPPFELVGTGLTLALEDCRLIIGDADVDTALANLGFTSAFRGVHAHSALLRWDIPLQIEGREVPGIDLILEGVAIGSEGVSLKGALSWPVVIEDGTFDPDQTEVIGYLGDPEWQCAIESAQAEVHANIPTGLGATGYLQIPFLNAILRLELSTSVTGGRLAMLLASVDDTSLPVPLGAADYQLQLQQLRLTSDLATDADSIRSLDLDGKVDLELALPGLNLTIGDTSLALRYRPRQMDLELLLGEVALAEIGSVRDARLQLQASHDGNGFAPDHFLLQGTILWSDLSSQVELAQIPDNFPLPPDDAELTLEVTWNGPQMHFRLKAELEDVDSLWRFLPQAQRPEVDEAEVTIDLMVDGSGFRGKAGLEFSLRLPEDISAGELIRIEAGDEESWTRASFQLVATDSGASQARLRAELSPPVRVELGLPGISLPEPPILVEIDTVELDLDGTDATGTFDFKGELTLRPLLPGPGTVPPALLQPMARLLAPLEIQELAAEVELVVGHGESGFYTKLEAAFSSATIELDLFDMLASTVSSAAGVDPGGSEIDLDMDLSLSLASLKASLGHGSGQGSGDAGFPMAIELGATLSFLGQSVEFTFALSSQELSCGLVELPIPIAIPELPVRRQHLNDLRGNDGRWRADRWRDTLEPELATELESHVQAFEEASARLQALPTSNASRQEAREAFELEHRVLPRLRRLMLELSARKFLIEAVLAIHETLGSLSGESAQNTFQTLTEQYQDLTDNTVGLLHGDTGVQFVIRDLRFVLPFDDPTNLRIEGGAGLEGFDPDGPLAGLNGLSFKAGISPEAIYFSIEGDGNTISLPEFGRYPGSLIRIGRLAIGYGYTRNSLKVDFAGELELSPQLIEDADTSTRAGIGLRLPRQSRLRFKLDLIPIVLGEIDFVLPLPAFDIDLRSDPPPAATQTTGCTPIWDGLQLAIPGVLHADFKGAAFSPFFGPLPAPNFRLGLDFELGNRDTGVSYICDDYRYIAPVAGTLPIPFLADTLPFFDRLCGEIRIAGFGITVDLARPFPQPGPLLIFELLGFLSDPSLPIDPAGELAQLMLAELRHARIRLPAPVAAMFPGQDAHLTRDYQMRIDIGTLITLAQNLVGVAGDLVERLATTGEDFTELTQAIVQDPPQPDLDALLDALPPELRRVELNGSLGNFEASATFLLITPEQMLAHSIPTQPPEETPTIRWQVVAEDHFDRGPLRHWRMVDHGLKRGAGDWQVSKGKLVQAANVGDNSPARYGAMLIRESEPLKDLRLQVEMTAKDNDGMGVVFFFENERTFHRFRMTSEQQRWELVRVRGGKVQSLHRTDDVFEPGRTYRVRIEARVLPPSKGSFRSHSDLSVRKTPGLRKHLARCHISIFVNDVRWCSLDGGPVAPSGGLAGLDSWWNQGVRYDAFVLESAERDSGSGPLTSPSDTPLARTAALASTLVPPSTTEGNALALAAGTPPWLPADLVGFTAEDIEAALGEEENLAVVASARIRLFDEQQYRMLGVMRGDGHFRLMTGATAEVLRLRVAGIENPLALQLQGRALLEGQSAGAESWARFTAELSGEWTLFQPSALTLPARSLPSLPLAPSQPLPKRPPSKSHSYLARLRLGEPADPVQLVLDARGRFQLRGNGALSLFDDIIQLNGRIDVTERYAMVQGQMTFALPPGKKTGFRIMELTLDASGKLGPGPHVQFRGEGQLKLLGMPFNGVSAQLSEQGMQLSARMESPLSGWSLKGFELAAVHMMLSGTVDLARSVPALDLRGEGGFEWYDLVVEGECGVQADHAGWCLSAAGRLRWQGLDWLQAGVRLCDDRMRVQGTTRFALELLPSQLPAGLQVAGLYLTGTISGDFTLRPSRSLASCRLEVQWTLAVRLPDDEPGQSLPIASQRVQASLPTISGPSRILLTLLEISGIRLLPLDDVTIPIPTLGDPTPYCAQINPPFLHECSESDGPLFSIPSVGIDALPLGELTQIANVGIKISVQWKHGQLGLKIGNQFFAFTDLLPPLSNE